MTVTLLDFVLSAPFILAAAAVLWHSRFVYFRVDTGNQKRVRQSAANYGAVALGLFALYGILANLAGIVQPWANIILGVLFIVMSIAVLVENLGLLDIERSRAPGLTIGASCTTSPRDLILGAFSLSPYISL